MILVCLLGILPWTARNFAVFGQIVPVRDNFWPEAYFGNVEFSLHPTGNSMLYQREGEISFAHDLRTRTVTFVLSKPGVFARLTERRVVAFWMQPWHLQPYPLILLLLTVGGVIRSWHRKRRWAACVSVLALYPVVYYITYTFARYRHPIEPLMYALAGYFVSELWDRNPRLPEASTALPIS